MRRDLDQQVNQRGEHEGEMIPIGVRAGRGAASNGCSLSQSPLLDVQNLRVRFELPTGALEVVRDISFSLMPNEILCIVGESGSGKTVMMHSLLGLLPVGPGVIGGNIWARVAGVRTNLLEGLERFVRWKSVGRRKIATKRAGWDRLYARRTRSLMGRQLGLIFQNPRNALDPLMTAGQQIVESVRRTRPEASLEAARAEALEWLERVHIDRATAVFDLYPHQLSGGMCQRVAIAQILALRSRILIADEPTTGLDATIQVGILDLVREVQRELGISVLLITHDFSVVERLADRILVLFRGQLMEEGGADELLLPGARLHPYTAELLRNVRVLEGAGGDQIERLGESVQEAYPPRDDTAAGCIFYRMCPLIMAGDEAMNQRCAGEQPPLKAISATHRIRCHVPERIGPVTL